MISSVTLASIPIVVNGKLNMVYKNQTVLQSLLQADELVEHSCVDYGVNRQTHTVCATCSVKWINPTSHHRFKACLIPVKAEMVLQTRPFQ